MYHMMDIMSVMLDIGVNARLGGNGSKDGALSLARGTSAAAAERDGQRFYTGG